MFLNKEAIIGIYDSVQIYPKFWTFGVNSSGSTITNFETNYTPASSSLRLSLGPNITQVLVPNTPFTYTYNVNSQGLTLIPNSQQLITQILKIDCGSSTPTLKGSINIKPYTGIQYFECINNGLTSFTGSQNLSSLSELYLNINSLSGNIPSLSANTSLIQFECRYNQLSGFADTIVSNTLDIFEADNNILTVQAVNNILAAFVAANRTTGTRILNLGGSGNAAPTGQGITDKNTLIANGWTVITN